jgi:hypothetical protein
MCPGAAGPPVEVGEGGDTMGSVRGGGLESLCARERRDCGTETRATHRHVNHVDAHSLLSHNVSRRVAVDCDDTAADCEAKDVKQKGR